MKERLLRLLLLHDGLETKEEWSTVLEDGDEYGTAMESQVHDKEQEGGGRTQLILEAIDAVVPYLSDYSAVSPKLKALMSSIGSTSLLVQGWLQHTPPHHVRFRRWVLCDWLKCSYLTSADPVELLQWRHALFVATTNERVKQLKWTTMKLLSEVNEMIGAQCGGDKVVETPTAALQSIENVEEVLDFCFVHAEQLASCSLLCAAKLHALAVKTRRSAIKISEDDEVMVRLRWSVILKPMLFKPLLQHAIAMKTIPANISASQVWMSGELAGLMRVVEFASRGMVLAKMAAGRDELERAFEFDAQHIHSPAAKAENRSVVEAAVVKYVESLSDEKGKLLLAELDRDLDEAPPHLFPHIFIYFQLLLQTTLLSTADRGLVVDAIGILFALFFRRSHDANSCLDVLGIVLRHSLAASPIWRDNSSFYLDTIESLSETAALQVDPKPKWAAKIALHQLLFECDVQLLQHNQSALSDLLPQHTMRLVAIRLGGN